MDLNKTKDQVVTNVKETVKLTSDGAKSLTYRFLNRICESKILSKSESVIVGLLSKLNDPLKKVKEPEQEEVRREETII